MSAATATPAASTKKGKKNKSAAGGDAPHTNGKLEAPSAATPAQSQREELLAERAENKAAVAAVALLADKTDQPTTPLTAAERILAKRSKALGKKLQRITQYEAQDSKTLNEDQKAVIASKDSVMAAMKELNEVGKAWKQAEQENVAAQQAETQKAVEHEKKSGEATGDAALTLLQQFLRLFTVLHLPQIQASTFAPTLSPGFSDSITAQEAAAVGRLYQDIVSQPLYSGAETGQSNEGSVKELLSAIEAGEAGKEALDGVTFARIKDLVCQLVAPSTSEVPSETVPAAAKSGADKGDEVINHEKASAQDAIDVAPELVEAPAAASQGSPEVGKDAPHANGKQAPPKSNVGSGEISFLQSSEVSRAASAAPSIHGNSEESADKNAAREPDQIATYSSGDDQVTSTEKASEKAASSAVQVSKFDWSADVEGGEDDLGDPMQAFPDQDSRSVTLRSSLSSEDKTEELSSNARVGYDAAAESEANGGLAVPRKSLSSPSAKAPESAEEVKTPAETEGTAAREQKGGKSNGNAAKPSSQQRSAPAPAAAAAASPSPAPAPAPTSKKGPIVDEDGFVLQTSKKSLHQQQQQQQQQQQASFRGRGRGRGGPRGGGGDRGGRGGGGAGGNGGGGRGRGEYRGGSRGGRGGVSGAGANGPPTPTPASTVGQ